MLSNLSNGTTFNTLSDFWPRFQGRHFLKPNILGTKLLKQTNWKESIPNISNGTMFGDLAWPLNARVCQYQLSFLFYLFHVMSVHGIVPNSLSLVSLYYINITVITLSSRLPAVLNKLFGWRHNIPSRPTSWQYFRIYSPGGGDVPA